MWREGTITIPGEGESTIRIKYQIKQYDKGSINGINGGRISKLWMKNLDTGEVVANYDRGWDIKPDETNQQVMAAYCIILNENN